MGIGSCISVEVEKMNEKVGVIEDLIDPYFEYCDEINEKISNAIKEGAKEGIEEGVKGGVLDGIAECYDIGFLNLRKTKVKEIDETLRDVGAETAQEQVKSIAREEICPRLQEKLQDICNTAVQNIEGQDIQGGEEAIYLARKFNIRQKLETKIKEIEQNMKKSLPENFLFTVLLEDLQNSICECFNESLDKCEKKIQETLKSRISE